MRNTCDYISILIIVVVSIQIALNAANSFAVANTVGSQNCEIEKPVYINPANGICSSMHIRNNLYEFGKLENCTVIEGYLQISLMEKIKPEDYLNWSFPLLQEITAYLTLYRLDGLKSLKHLFPNLAIIGGRELFNNYAFVIFQLTDLEELGLVNLRTISRGGVRIVGSKQLCYVSTVDWEHLGVDSSAQDFMDNKEDSQCANYCRDECIKAKNGDTRRCWTSEHCQLGLNCRCNMNQTCMDDGTCCHEYCLGGCTGTGPENCFSCKDVSYKGRCLQECPPGTYKYADRRCLTAKECFAIINNAADPSKNTKILNSTKAELRLCVKQCPQNYSVREDGELRKLECIKCEGFCPKVCNGTEVKGIEDAQKLRDCSKIVGNLVIQILGGSNVAYEMEKNLGNIKEVTGSINIIRSYALLTLYFLKSLEIIGGETLFDRRYSFVVMDNSQLQDLFPEDQMTRMKLKKGIMSFHSNRKLCKSKIITFVKNLNLTESEQDIGDNGNLMPCVERHLSLNVTSIYHNTVVLNWETDNADDRHLMAYIINYKEIKSKDEDINIYEGRDACSADTWMTNEAAPLGDSKSFQTYALKDLKAFTEYAVYVQAYTLSSATHSAMTSITTFKTNPYYPSEPVDLEVISDDPFELYVRWKPPKFPNGIVTHYKVLYQVQELDIKSFEQRDYCLEPIIVPPSEAGKKEKEETEKTHNVTAACCSCPKTKEEREAEARKREIEIYFENYLHDQVYCQRYDTLPSDIIFGDFGINVTLRSFISKNTNASFGDDILYSSIPLADNGTHSNVAQNHSWTGLIQEVIVNSTTDIYLPNLEHFKEYSIEVQACHDTNPNEPVGSKLCSNRALTAGRTKAAWMMDKINESTIQVHTIKNTTVDILITWEAPPKPNGLILTYNILYKRANKDNTEHRMACVNISEYKKHSGFRLSELDPGNWTFQINAISLAGNSSLTSEKYFIVPHFTDPGEANKAIIILTVFAVAIIIIVAISVSLYIRYRKHRKPIGVFDPNPIYVSSEPYTYSMDGWEVDRDKIELIKELGQGSFGMVYEGLAKGIGDDPEEERRVAVKTVNDRASFNDKREILKEATIMKAFDCFHVVKLLGVVSTGQPALVIMELMALGDLKNYLREHRPDEQERPGVSPPKLLDILQMAGEIADGMAYLADKKFVHRDLAARNCMVDEDKTVKIADFGMTRDIYETDYYRKGGKGMLPVRWMAPESLRDGVFTSMSDVWSYGVVMWEMVTLAAQPYQGLSNEEAVKFISENNIMDIPEGCPQEMAYLMQRCWTKKASNRPTFKQIIEYLLPHLNPRFEKVSYFYNDGGGPTGGDGNLNEYAYQAEGDFDAGSINSQNCEAAAAMRQSFSNLSGNYQFHASSHSSGDSVSFYDDDIDPERYMNNEEDQSYHRKRDSHLNESFEDFGDYKIHNEFSGDFDDSSQPFISDEFPAIPLVKMSHPPLQSHHQSGNDSTQHNSGLEVLQPLINKNFGSLPSSSRPTNVQSSGPYSSEHTSHLPPSVATYDLRMPGESQVFNPPQHKTDADSLKSGTASSSRHLGQPSQVSSGKQLLSSLITQPTLRLPTLNQPPSGGFRRVPAYKQGDKVSSYSSKSASGHDHQSNSGDWDHHHHHHVDQPSTSTNVIGVDSEEKSSPTSPSQESIPPQGAITSSSDDSKESSKSSGSHSHINGLTNGHIPIMRHRIVPC